MKIWSWCVNTKSVNMLIGPMADSDSWPVCAHIRLGPNTTARLDEVILFKSLRSITYRTRETHNLRFWQHCCWEFQTSGKWQCHWASDSVSLGHWFPAFKRHYGLSKQWKPPTHWHCVRLPIRLEERKTLFLLSLIHLLQQNFFSPQSGIIRESDV